MSEAREAYARGWTVLPLHAGTKRPNLPRGHGFLHSKPTREDYAGFDMSGNYAIVCGELSGITVLDIDDASVLDRHDIVLPLAPTVHTPSGGMHLYFTYHPDAKTGVGVVGGVPGIDIRNDGSYVVGVGSIVDGQEYVWDDDMNISSLTLSSPPDWMRQRIGGKDRPADYDLTDKIGEGRRNSTLASIAGALNLRSVPAGIMLTALRSVNDTHLDPPLPDDEVRQIVDTNYRSYDNTWLSLRQRR